MKILALALILFASVASASDITGAGASFPYPLYMKWADAYYTKDHAIINYQSIGSGGGIKQVKASTVDFGATDMPLKIEELEQFDLMQFPTVIGGVVPVINIASIQSLKLDGDTLAKIFMGDITMWNDAAIAALNPNTKLPNISIAVIHRSDGSGTTFIFTNYLSKINAKWKSVSGEGTAISWPTGMGGKGNEGVAAIVLRTNGSIGYVEYTYAMQTKMGSVELKNKSGVFVHANWNSFKAAATNANWDPSAGFYVILTDQLGKESWPMSGATFILMHKSIKNPDVLKFFDWAYDNGNSIANDLDYVPLPTNVQNLIRVYWRNVK